MDTETRDLPIVIAREIARQGEVRLAALLSLSVAADARANTMCGIFGATSTAAMGGALACLTTPRLSQLAIAAGTMAVMLFASAILAATVSAPTSRFNLPGGQPRLLRDWAWTGDAWRDEVAMLDASSMRYAKLIQANARNLEGRADRLLYALWLAVAALPLGALTYFFFGG